MSARHVNADTPMVGCAIVPGGACPWCRAPLTTDDRLGAVRVGHAVLHAGCAEQYEQTEQVYEAAYPPIYGRATK